MESARLSCIFVSNKKRKAAGCSPCASHPNVAKFIRRCDRPCRTSPRRRPRDSPAVVRDHNRPKRTPKLRHRRPDVHGRILRRPPATLRMALRRRRPLHARQRIDTVFRLDVGMRMPARSPVSAPVDSFIGSGTAFRTKSKRLRWTITVIRVKGRNEPWTVLTALRLWEKGSAGGDSYMVSGGELG